VQFKQYRQTTAALQIQKWSRNNQRAKRTEYILSCCVQNHVNYTVRLLGSLH